VAKREICDFFQLSTIAELDKMDDGSKAARARFLVDKLSAWMRKKQHQQHQQQQTQEQQPLTCCLSPLPHLPVPKFSATAKKEKEKDNDDDEKRALSMLLPSSSTSRKTRERVVKRPQRFELAVTFIDQMQSEEEFSKGPVYACVLKQYRTLAPENVKTFQSYDFHVRTADQCVMLWGFSTEDKLNQVVESVNPTIAGHLSWDSYCVSLAQCSSCPTETIPTRGLVNFAGDNQHNDVAILIMQNRANDWVIHIYHRCDLVFLLEQRGGRQTMNHVEGYVKNRTRYFRMAASPPSPIAVRFYCLTSPSLAKESSGGIGAAGEPVVVGGGDSLSK
jgi:hypothetical protein